MFRSFAQFLLLTALGLPLVSLAQPTVSVEAMDTNASELGADVAVFRFSRTDSTASGLAVMVTFDITTTATGAAGLDYTDNNSGQFGQFAQLTIPVGEPFFDIVITPQADNLVENEERIDITLAASSNYVVGSQASAGVTISDDPPIVTVTASNPEVAEGDTGTFTFTRSGGNLARTLPVVVTFDPTTTATGNLDWEDNNNGFFRSFGQLTIPANAPSFDLIVTAHPDNLAEGDEAIDISLAAGNYIIAEPSSAGMNIIDDAPIVTVTASNPEAAEGDTGTFTFTRSGGNLASPLPVVVTFDPTTTATGSLDWEDNNNGFFRSFGTLTIPANALFFDLIVTVHPDNLTEGDEFLDITLAPGSAYLVGIPASASMILLDNLIFRDGFEVSTGGKDR